MDLEAIQQIFFQECEEGLAGMEADFAALRDGDDDPERVNAIFRCVHSVKGGAGAFGFERLQAFTHQYETLLDHVRNGTLSLTPTLLETILAAYDLLNDHVAAARDSTPTPADTGMIERLVAAAGKFDAPERPTPEVRPAVPAMAIAAPATDEFDDLLSLLNHVSPDNPTVEDMADWVLTYQPCTRALDHGSEPMLLLRELYRLGGRAIAYNLSTMPPLEALDPNCSYIGWTIRLPSLVDEDDIRAVFDFAEPGEFALSRSTASTELDAAAMPHLEDEETIFAILEDAARLTPEPVISVGAEAPLDLTAPLNQPDGAVEQSAADRSAATNEPRAAPRALPAGTQTIRVDLDKLDRLVNLVGELVITQAMLAQRLAEANMGATPELTDLEHLTRELQESTMAIRAQPMKTVFSRVPRIIRELEGETGKRVRLDVEGEMTEVDKTVVERIGEPLTHLIRNAVDHGLETPEVREAAGKPPEGVVRLSAAHQSGRIVITVADDGKGIDRQRVRAKAIEKGIINADALLTDEEIDNLIFAPGFSTAATVSNISGRGVGMDVVRKNIQALGGRITIQSREGAGSSFSLSLPLTLAVLDGMIVTVGDQTLVIPLSHIVESLRPTQTSLSQCGPSNALLDVRGAYVPVLSVADQLGVVGAERDPTRAVLIVVDGDQGQSALLVDTIIDQRQVVVKSLESNYQAIDGIAGATILGNGRVALIVDVDTLTARGRAPARLALASAA
jgi:two-component system chemotaxis sensor kinase CheA